MLIKKKASFVDLIYYTIPYYDNKKASFVDLLSLLYYAVLWQKGLCCMASSLYYTMPYYDKKAYVEWPSLFVILCRTMIERPGLYGLLFYLSGQYYTCNRVYCVFRAMTL